MQFNKKIEKDYFNWLYDYVCKNKVHDKLSYKNLLTFLHSIEFTFSINNDINRAKDGESLRHKYGLLIDNPNIIEELYGPCSVLEMMIALAIKCEDSFMDDISYGDRTTQWFWTMINNLGLSSMSDDNFDLIYTGNVIQKFIDREYDHDGKGGLFYIKDSNVDLRDIEIWGQLCSYLNRFAI